MAFGAEELRVLRRALALALHPSPVSAEDVQDCLRLAESLDEATRESARLRAFLVADLARYRAALPGTAAGYLTLLDEALSAGHRPTRDDLAALRALRGNPTAAALLDRCHPHTAAVPAPTAAVPARTGTVPAAPAPAVPAARTRLLALPGGRSGSPCDGPHGTLHGTPHGNPAGPYGSLPGARGSLPGAAARAAAQDGPAERPDREPAEKPAPRPSSPDTTKRPVPTPGEVFPRRKPAPPAAAPGQHLAVG
ncbi:hypothetical protein [Streptomyces ziwulingensis]|uniref:hypothetical protein n=1 Tax=Streptomyces ziwulingensis TaxID=1045501 RepID=UPI003CD072AB